MKRRIFTAVSALSLLLLIAVLFSWIYLLNHRPVRFYTRSAQYAFSGPPRALIITVMGGTLRPNGTFNAPQGKHWDGAWANPQELPLGFGFGRSPPSDPEAAPYLGLVVPWWVLFFFTAILPCLWTLLHLRPRRGPRFATCVKCGYDLRASPDKCPECGTAVQASSA